MLVSEFESGEVVLSSNDLAQFVDRLASVDDTAADAELIDQITQLERMKSACAAAQAKLTVAFATAQTAAQPTGQQRNTSVQRKHRRAHRPGPPGLPGPRRPAPRTGHNPRARNAQPSTRH